MTTRSFRRYEPIADYFKILQFFSTIIARIRYQHYNLESSYTGPILKEDHMHITSFPRITELQSSTFDATVPIIFFIVINFFLRIEVLPLRKIQYVL